MRKRWRLAVTPVLLSCGGGSTLMCPSPPTFQWNGVLPSNERWDGGAISDADCMALCSGAGVSTSSCKGISETQFQCSTICRGRAPPGVLVLSQATRSVGSWIAQGAEFEAAAVYAFHQLAFELEVHGLSAYAAAARVAAGDEVRHARVTTGLALRYGACPSSPRVELPPEPRSLEELVLDNAAEGCGRELLGVEINRWQAEHAEDEAVRSAMAVIAEEEAQHARLSFALAESMRVPLSVRRRAREAQERALLQLASADAPQNVRSVFGLMDSEQATRTARRLIETKRLG